jgi:ABC-type dipeptide/oligopeptide/nickel transport system permease component
VGLLVGFVFALILLQVTRPDVDDLAARGGYGISPESYDQIKGQLGKSPVIFWPFSGSYESWLNRRSVTGLVWGGGRITATLELLFLGGGLALLITWGLGMALGRGQPSTTAARIVIACIAAIPIFWLGVLLIWRFAVQSDWLPAGAHVAFSENPAQNIRHLLLPIFSIGLVGGASMALEIRTKDEDSPFQVLMRSLGLMFRHGGLLISGVIFIELVFSLNGLGRLAFTAANNADGTVLGAAAAMIIWIALWSRLIGNLILAEIDSVPTQSGNSTAESNSSRAPLIAVGVSVALLAILFVIPFVSSDDPTVPDLSARFADAGSGYLLGTDQFGRDIFGRVLHAGRTLAVVVIPLAALSLAVGSVMAAVRKKIERSGSSNAFYAVEGVLEGLASVPWLITGIVVYAAIGHTWPFVALVVILVPRALRVGWNLGAGSRAESMPSNFAIAQIAVLFLAAAAAMSIGLSFLGSGVVPPRPDLGADLAASRDYIASNGRIMITIGLVASLFTAVWLSMATLTARTTERYRGVGWADVMS